MKFTHKFMINARRSRAQRDQMAELQRERLRLLQERSNYRSNVETTEVHRRQNGNTTMPIIRRTNSNKLASEFNALMNQTTTNEIRPSERHER